MDVDHRGVGVGDALLAGALAEAFLTVDWAMPDLLDVGRRTLGTDRAPWLNSCITALLGLYPGPPERPEELAAELAALPVFRRAQAVARAEATPVRIARRFVAPTRMGPTRWAVLPLHDLGDLAALLGLGQGELAWFADRSDRQRRAPARRQLYRWVWRARPGRAPRLLEIPNGRLATAQRILLREVLEVIEVHPAAHGFVPGRDVYTGAAPHAGAPTLLSLDVEAFFAHVGAAQVGATLRAAGYPAAVAREIAGVCTSTVPARVLTAMPPGGSAEARFALGRALAAPHLPQGAPSSPHLANLAAHRLDRRIAGLAATAGLTYTRYADDLTLSGERPQRLLSTLTRVVADEGLRLNATKIRIRGAGRRQIVTGLVVNAAPAVPRAEYDRLRAVLHNAARTGPAAQNRDGHADFRSHLLGRISWVGRGHPARAERLAAAFAAIDWS